MVFLCIKKVNILSEYVLAPEINKERQRKKRKSGITRNITSIFQNSTNYLNPENIIKCISCGEEGEEKNDPPQVRSPHSYLENEIFSSQQLARELKMALVSEIESSQSLRNLIEDLKSSHETSKVSASLYAF